MVYTKMTIKAINIAFNAHAGQTDGTGVPYIFHPYHLAEQMNDEISCTVALLHDVVEDTSVTFEDLEKEFPSAVIKPLKLLTHSAETDYFEYVKAIKTSEVATKVKLADLNHNLDQTRNANNDIPKEKLRYWKEKYSKAKAILLQ